MRNTVCGVSRKVATACILWFLIWGVNGPAWSGTADTVERVKSSVVAVGTFQKERKPAFKFLGTGFAVGDGSFIATNAHVLPAILDVNRKETLVVVINKDKETQIREAQKAAIDELHDVALLKIPNSPLPTLTLSDITKVREGETYMFTGFPIGSVLGPYPVTHRGMISAITPIAIPSPGANQLDPKLIKRLSNNPYPVFQLDATAYPGNSGSPLYDSETGAVIGIINMVFVKGTKEAGLTNPSGITYAIPAKHLKSLMDSVR